MLDHFLAFFFVPMITKAYLLNSSILSETSLICTIYVGYWSKTSFGSYYYYGYSRNGNKYNGTCTPNTFSIQENNLSINSISTLRVSTGYSYGSIGISSPIGITHIKVTNLTKSIIIVDSAMEYNSEDKEYEPASLSGNSSGIFSDSDKYKTYQIQFDLEFA